MTRLRHAQLGIAAAQNFTKIAYKAPKSVREFGNYVFTLLMAKRM
jgi:hypothetical protein